MMRSGGKREGVRERRGHTRCVDPLSYFLTWVLRSIHFSSEEWEEADHFMRSASMMRVLGIRWRRDSEPSSVVVDCGCQMGRMVANLRATLQRGQYTCR
jgi:hypothetical protein